MATISKEPVVNGEECDFCSIGREMNRTDSMATTLTPPPNLCPREEEEKGYKMWGKISVYIKTSTLEFLGLTDICPEEHERWEAGRRRLASKVYGNSFAKQQDKWKRCASLARAQSIAETESRTPLSENKWNECLTMLRAAHPVVCEQESGEAPERDEESEEEEERFLKEKICLDAEECIFQAKESVAKITFQGAARAIQAANRLRRQITAKDEEVPDVDMEERTRSYIKSDVDDQVDIPQVSFDLEGLGSFKRKVDPLSLVPGTEFLQRVAEKKLKKGDYVDKRPYFTYWITTVHITVMLFAILIYGIAPVGFNAKEELSQADLIRLGAKYSPCMRKDKKIFTYIQSQKVIENETACCVRNDGSGCLQTKHEACSDRLSTWHKWTPEKPGPEGRHSGSVCGQDPRFCLEPSSVAPHKWPDDITNWPMCRKSVSLAQNSEQSHMTCDLTGNPCCMGIHAECHITTREYCDFVRGYFHENATLCSQVSCLGDICGMLNFLNPEVPDQFYRVYTSLFIHAGIFHLLITVFLQFYLLWYLEKYIGTSRIAIIYCMSGIAGNLASAIFLPYRAEVGPSGSMAGLVLTHFIILVDSFMHPVEEERPAWSSILKWVVIMIVMLFLGFLPSIDNYAMICGAIMGGFLAFAIIPNLYYKQNLKKRRVLWTLSSLLSSIGLLVFLILFLYVLPVYDCQLCEYLNCVPITETFCADQKIQYDVHEKL